MPCALDESTKDRVRKLWFSGQKRKDIAAECGICAGSVTNIINEFISGFQKGYDHWWKSARQLSNQQITQGTEQNAAVNIRANGNHVTVSQQSNNRAGSGEDDGGGSDSGANPRCTFLCANVQIK